MWLRVYHVRVPEVDTMIKYLTMFRDGATLAFEIAHIVLVLAHAFSFKEDESVLEVPRLTLMEKLVPAQLAVEMNGRPGGPVFLVHPIEGHVGSLWELARHLPVRAVGLQRTRDVPAGSIEELAAIYLKVRSHRLPSHRPAGARMAVIWMIVVEQQYEPGSATRK
ncbi:hypothetical protein HPB47_002591 [Ixodes persulcatus]|uniref:Uncharacterized protein n=1 Tax=Ixodes persulcatus TaxID=34615 RepID=A0AC60PLR5_IXOPE|nr:hypothetical protein HPB47_002591 [Ixodes persulcatus]